MPAVRPGLGWTHSQETVTHTTIAVYDREAQGLLQGPRGALLGKDPDTLPTYNHFSVSLCGQRSAENRAEVAFRLYTSWVERRKSLWLGQSVIIAARRCLIRLPRVLQRLEELGHQASRPPPHIVLLLQP